MPVVDATPESLADYGTLVIHREEQEIEIVRWPAQGWRPVDPDCGDEGGTTEGVFLSEWKGDILYGRNEAVGGHYIIGYGAEPSTADDTHTRPPDCILLWHEGVFTLEGSQRFFDKQGAVHARVSVNFSKEFGCLLESPTR